MVPGWQIGALVDEQLGGNGSIDRLIETKYIYDGEGEKAKKHVSIMNERIERSVSKRG